MPVYNQNPTVKNRPMGRKDSQGNLIPSTFNDMSIRNDYVGGANVIYHAEARPGALEGDLVWKISKSSYDGSNHLLDTKWPQDANGKASADYQFSYSARAGYTYV